MRCCFITLGCRVNQYESDAMAELVSNAGYEVVSQSEIADVCIINTCTVTNIADRKSRQMLSKAHRLNPNAKIIVCGCLSQRNPEGMKKLDGVDAVLGSADKNRIVEIIKTLFDDDEEGKQVYVRDVMHEHQFEEMSATHEGRCRAYLKIQDGCNMFCTYCAIPYARGAIRSRSLASIRREAEKLNNDAYPEVVLTGIHLMSYGKDLPEKTNILDAVKCFNGLDNIKRIRFGSLEPHLMTDEIINGLAENKRICRQFHLSLQSGSTSVLARMKRGYTAGEYLELTRRIKNAFGNETAFTTDIIAGFPGETEKEHLETVEFMRAVPFSKVHVFPYSRRSGTPADRMDGQLTNKQKSDRARQLIDEGKKLEQEFISSFIGKEMSVLIEENVNGSALGCTDNFIKVRVPCTLEPNKLYCLKLIAIEDVDGEIRAIADKNSY